MTSPALQEVVALLGCPAAGNPAQYLFERMIAAAGLDWQFVTLDVQSERIAEAIQGVAAMGFRGCLLSGPLRAAAFPTVASASAAAAGPVRAGCAAASRSSLRLTAIIRAYISLASGYRSRKFRQEPPRRNLATLVSRGSAPQIFLASMQASCDSGGSTHSIISR